MPHCTVCLIGDDRPRRYHETWHGKAEIGDLGKKTVALVETSNGREALIYKTRRRWVPVHDLPIRDIQASKGYPAMTDYRLRRAI